MKEIRTMRREAAGLLIAAAAISLTGCFGFLKPARTNARHFVLTPLPAAEPKPGGPVFKGVGIGQIKIPPYLFETSLAARDGTNEINYLPAALWAERLDNGLQRVLAANLSILLPTDQIRLSAWRSEEISAEVYVVIEQFDVDTTGRAVLAGWWRILAPGGEKTLKTGECRVSRQGPPPEPDPSGAVATLSELAADLSRQVAEAIKETAPTGWKGVRAQVYNDGGIGEAVLDHEVDLVADGFGVAGDGEDGLRFHESKWALETKVSPR